MYIYTAMPNYTTLLHCITMVTTHTLVSRIGVMVLLAVAIPIAWSKRVPKQVHTKGAVIESEADHNAAESGFGGAGIGVQGKYFQYQHNPEHDHYEFGFRRGNDHHFKERYEKGHPHAGQFKTKVRWGDKHGGYGEQYWDYNHAGHGGDEGGDEGGEGGHSEPVPQYHDHHHDEYHNDQRVKRNHQQQQQSRLVFDPATGRVIDEATGQIYVLQALPAP